MLILSLGLAQVAFAADDLKIKPEDTIKKVLGDCKGKAVTVRLAEVRK